MFHLKGAVTFLSSARRWRGFYARLGAATIGKGLGPINTPTVWRANHSAVW
jgi:hypothetical protein